MRYFKSKFWPICILFFINCLFFIPLFFPHLKLIVTPEYGGGDENLFHYPTRFLLQASLRRGEFILWSKAMGGGYPVFAMGEAGFFNPINFLTMLLLPFAQAINIQIFFSIMILLLFVYCLGRTLKFGQVSSIFFSTVFSYSFFILSNLIHVSHLASFIYIPAVFALLLRIMGENKFNYISYVLLSFCLFFQFISGHPQYFFYSTLLIYFYLLVNLLFNKREKRKSILLRGVFVSVSFVAALAMSAFQLIPIMEYYGFSNRSGNVNFSVSGGLNIKDLLSLFYPFVFYGSDLKMRPGTNAILPPWDGNLYFGFIPLLLIIIGLMINKKIRMIDFIEKHYFFILGSIFFLLALGSNSPLYFINASPPFSFFRVPARIVFLIILIGSAISSYVFEKLYRKNNPLIKFSLIVCLAVNILINMLLMYRFHVLLTPEEYMTKNQVASFVQNNQIGRFLSIYFYEEVLPRELYENGISKKNNLNLKMVSLAMPQNVNQFFGLKTLNLPSSGFNFNRHFLFDEALFSSDESYSFRQETQTASLSAAAKGLLGLSDISLILSPYKIFDPNQGVELVSKYTVDSSNYSVYLYKNLNFNHRLSFSTQPVRIYTFKQFKDALAKVPDSDSVYVESDYPGNEFSRVNLKPDFSYRILSDNNGFFSADVKSSSGGVLTLADNYYPGWRASVDDKPVKIFRANFLYRGIVLSPGKHRVKFIYQPDSLTLGIVISGLTFLIITSSIIVYLKKRPRFF